MSEANFLAALSINKPEESESMAPELGCRERVLRTIDYKDIDRVPFFFRADQAVNERIKKRYGLKDDMDILSFYGSDAIQASLCYKDDFLKKPEEDGSFYDIYGNRFKTVDYNNYSTTAVIEPVLAQASGIDDIYKIRWPDKSVIDMEESLRRVEQARSTGLAVYGGMWASIFTIPRSMVGEEDFLVSLIDNPDFIIKLVERITDFFIEINELFFSKCSKYVDIFYFGSDFGTQNSMFISRDMFRRFFKPSMARLANHAKQFGLKVMFHTCGAVNDIIPDLIESGVDILDPVQVSAANMSPSLLAKKYSGKIVFHGGISTQKTLPFAGPETVREEVVNCIKTLGPLGYIASPDQEMIGDIPLENIDMMCKTVKHFSWL